MGYQSELEQEDPEDADSRLMLAGRFCVIMAYFDFASTFKLGVRGVTYWSSEEELNREEDKENG